jgi:hypothetical protein
MCEMDAARHCRRGDRMIERAMAPSGREMSGLSLESAPKRTLTRSLSPFPILCTRPPPKEISLTDPQAAWVARKSTIRFLLMTQTISSTIRPGSSSTLSDPFGRWLSAYELCLKPPAATSYVLMWTSTIPCPEPLGRI